jgi:hypothetical protein
MSARRQHANKELNGTLPSNYKRALPQYKVNNTIFSEVEVCHMKVQALACMLLLAPAFLRNVLSYALHNPHFAHVCGLQQAGTIW